MLLCNAIFRAGGAACLLTTGGGGGGGGGGGRKNKYRLVATERTHLGRDDAAFRCMGQAFDPLSNSLGVFLNKNVGEVAARAVRLNLEKLGPRALPLSELARAALSRALLAGGGGGSGGGLRQNKKLPLPHQPSFERSFAQVYPHAGGPAVLDAMQRSLRLSDDKMRASRAVWARFGNLSSASTLYATAFAESQPRGIKKGDRSLVMGLGGCFKADDLLGGREGHQGGARGLGVKGERRRERERERERESKKEKRLCSVFFFCLFFLFGANEKSKKKVRRKKRSTSTKVKTPSPAPTFFFLHDSRTAIPPAAAAADPTSTPLARAASSALCKAAPKILFSIRRSLAATFCRGPAPSEATVASSSAIVVP